MVAVIEDDSERSLNASCSCLLLLWFIFPPPPPLLWLPEVDSGGGDPWPGTRSVSLFVTPTVVLLSAAEGSAVTTAGGATAGDGSRVYWKDDVGADEVSSRRILFINSCSLFVTVSDSPPIRRRCHDGVAAPALSLTTPDTGDGVDCPETMPGVRVDNWNMVSRDKRIQEWLLMSSDLCRPRGRRRRHGLALLLLLSMAVWRIVPRDNGALGWRLSTAYVMLWIGNRTYSGVILGH